MENRLIQTIDRIKYPYKEDILRHLYSPNDSEYVYIHERSISFPSLSCCIRMGNVWQFLKTLAALVLGPVHIGIKDIAMQNTFGYDYYQMVASLTDIYGEYIHMIPKCSPLRTRIYHSFMSIPKASFLCFSSHDIPYRKIRNTHIGQFGAHPSCISAPKEYKYIWYSRICAISVIQLRIKMDSYEMQIKRIQRERDQSNIYLLLNILPMSIIYLIQKYMQYGYLL